MRPINRIIIHCAATPEGGHYTAADIDRWHRARGWAGIGYHAVILLDGTVEPGRPVERIGAHAVGHNHDSLAVCYIGGVATDGKTPKDTRTPRQMDALFRVVRTWMQEHGVPADQVLGHRELDPRKACPSFDVGHFRRLLRAQPPAPPTPQDVSARFAADLRCLLGDVLTEDLRDTDVEPQARALQRAVGAADDAILGPKTWDAVAELLADIADINTEKAAPPRNALRLLEGAGHD